MNAASYVEQKQLLWAARRGLTLLPALHREGQRPARTRTADANLFEPLSPVVREEFLTADGGELAGRVPKLHSVYSSAALVVNVFHYWRSHKDLASIARVLRIPSTGIEAAPFEAQLPIAASVDRTRFPKDPNLDILIRYHPGSSTRLVGIESKFSEAYSGREHAGLRPAYFERADLWNGLPACRELAEAIRRADASFRFLHAAQLLKHILGLRHACGGTTKFRLVYLWYDVPFDAGQVHRQEIAEFAKRIRPDGIVVQSITYQEVILRLAARYRDKHATYVDYLTERYL